LLLAVRVNHGTPPVMPRGGKATLARVTADSFPPPSARPLRFGLVGTGYWARITHAPALASTPGAELAAIWGRDPDAARALASRYDATAHGDLDQFLADIDAVAFSVPPDVQGALAVRAARAGKHLLLEKPLCFSEPVADALAEAADEASVASVVFFTTRFLPAVRTWLAGITRDGGWAGGSAVWLGSSLRESSPFNTPWRRDKGGLWDLGPHAISLLWAALGPVQSVTADAGGDDVTHLVLHHRGGATSTVTVTQSASEAADGFDACVWGEAGRSTAPVRLTEPVAALRVALTELCHNARSGYLAHECDVHFGRAVTTVLAEAQRQVDAIRA
jgi:predicted dehydrogenase